MDQGTRLLGAPAPAPPPLPNPNVLLPAPANVPLTKPAPPVWPRSAQYCVAALLTLALVLLAWHAYLGHRISTRPTTLERDALLTERIDLNRADFAQLRQLPGVGDNLAARILDHRRRHGPFRRFEDLRQVKGVGPVMLERLKTFVQVGPYNEEGDETAGEVRVVRAAAPDGAGRGKKKPPASPLDVNRASATELQEIPGIGPTISRRIIETRRRRPFASVDDLRRVKGIGAKTLARLRPYLTVGR
jgi:competence protein ComEA